MKRAANEYSVNALHLISINSGLNSTVILLGGDSNQAEFSLAELSNTAVKHRDPVASVCLSTP